MQASQIFCEAFVSYAKVFECGGHLHGIVIESKDIDCSMKRGELK
jgi:hypothetical protein